MAAEVAYDVRPRRRAPAPSPSRPALRVLPAPRNCPPSRRELAYAVTLGLVLALGVLGALVLNTLMQQQARTIAAQHAALGVLSLRQQTLQLELDATDNPRELARRARALHMRPGGLLEPLRPARPGSVRVSAPGRGKPLTHGG